jgi:SET domain-containing protein
MMSTTLETDSVIVKGSAVLKDQFGVFTKKKFKKGETIFPVKGPVMTTPTRYSFSLDIDKHIDPVQEDGQFDLGHYLNHSCDPNTFVRIVDEQTSSHIDIVARRDIAEDEELNFDYASLEYDTIAQVACECDTLLCRGKIHGFRDLPEQIKENYEDEGMIPAYLLKMEQI